MTTHGSPKRPASWPGRYDPPGVPPFLPSASLWSRPFVFIAALALVILLLPGSWFNAMGMPITIKYPILMIVLMVLGFFEPFVDSAVSTEPLAQRLKQGELPCWECGYDLATLTPTICPECGIEYDSSALRDRLAKCVGLRHAPTAPTAPTSPTSPSSPSSSNQG